MHDGETSQFSTARYFCSQNTSKNAKKILYFCTKMLLLSELKCTKRFNMRQSVLDFDLFENISKKHQTQYLPYDIKIFVTYTNLLNTGIFE